MNVFVIVLCLAVLTESHSLTRRSYRGRSRLLDDWPNFRRLQRHLASGQDNCQQLSNAAIALMRFYYDSDFLPPEEFPRDKVVEITERSFGFDPFHDKAAVEEFFCAITPARSILDLKARLDSHNDYNYRLFNLAYDYLVAGVLYASGPAVSEENQRDLDTMRSLGLLSLDPEGTLLMADLLLRNSETVPNAGLVKAPSTGQSLPQKCHTLQSFVWSKILPKNEVVKDQILSWTGIDLNDKYLVDRLLCDIIRISGWIPNGIPVGSFLDGESDISCLFRVADGWRSISKNKRLPIGEAADVDLVTVYRIIDDYGIVDHLYYVMYPAFQHHVKRDLIELSTTLTYMEVMLDEYKLKETETESGHSRSRIPPEILTIMKLTYNFELQLDKSGLLHLT